MKRGTNLSFVDIAESKAIVSALSRARGRVYPALLIFFCISLVALFLVYFTAAANAAMTDGRIFYGASGSTTPQSRIWDHGSGAWGSPAGTVATNTVVRWSVNQASPARLENIAGALASTGNTLYVQRWSGSSWSSAWSVATATSTRRSFDIAYEESTGRAMVVYSTGTNCQYRIWDGTSWTAAVNALPSAATGNIEWIELVSRPNSNEIALVYAFSDGTTGHSLRGIIWNGSAWGTQSAVLESNLAYDAAGGDTKSFDAAYENSGDLFVVFGRDASAAGYYVTKTAGSSLGQRPLLEPGRMRRLL